jgi:Skp family chaperone for outer membrane proteins
MALNFDEFQKVVETAQQADAVKADLKRALKKVTGALENLQTALSDMEKVMADDYVAAPKERKARTPRQPKADTDGEGTTHKKPGRPRKSAE